MVTHTLTQTYNILNYINFVNALQKILHVCEKELDWLDLTINVSKSSCMRMGPHFKVHCSNIVSIYRQEIKWSNSIRYLGVCLTANSVYSCSFSHAKRSFYTSFSLMLFLIYFETVGRVASEEVVVQLIKKKCLPDIQFDFKTRSGRVDYRYHT